MAPTRCGVGLAQRFSGLGAVVTGAGSGIGRATALRIAFEGGRVICLDLDDNAAADTARVADQTRGTASPIACDIADEEALVSALAAAIDVLGTLDVLVANAGVAGPVGSITEMSGSDWERLLNVNLTGQVLCAKHVLSHMIARGRGSIVFTASHVAFAGVPRWTPYAATKGGVLSLTRGLAVDHAPHGIRVNCVCPGPISTPLLHGGWSAVGDEAEGAIAARGRVGTPEEVAAVIAFLASPEASLVTGASVVADGGASAHMGTSWPSPSYWQ